MFFSFFSLLLVFLINDGKWTDLRTSWITIITRTRDFLGVQSSYYEEQLFKELFQNYNPLIRPVRRVEDTVTVGFSIALLQLISVVEKEQFLKTNVWLQVVRENRHFLYATTSFGRNGTTISWNGNKRNTVELNRFGFHRAKFGRRM